MNTIKPGKLVIVRHHESVWNKEGKWTGIHDAHLTPYGFDKSEEMGKLVKDICFNNTFASMEVRSIETLSSMLNVCTADEKLPTIHAAELNERDYGDYTGMNKWEVEKKFSPQEFEELRRGWNHPVPRGETLKMVYERAVPFFLKNILPLVNEGKNVLVVSHGNTIRCLMKYIENISDENVIHTEAPFGAILVYDVDVEGHIIDKEVRSVESSVPA